MSKSEAEPKPPSSPAVLNKELIKQFDKVLSVSCQKTDQRKNCLTGGVRQGSVQRKRRSRKKKVFVLRPSRLKLDPVQDDPTPSNHFSFEKCSKELESILEPSSSSCSQPLRPRSASLPSHQPKSDVPKSGQTMVKKSLVKPAAVSVKDRVVKKRKHLSPGEEAKAETQRKTSTCAQQARQDTELTQDIDRLADYLEESVLLPKKMSYMAEMMYTWGSLCTTYLCHPSFNEKNTHHNPYVYNTAASKERCHICKKAEWAECERRLIKNILPAWHFNIFFVQKVSFIQ